ncbi:argininosuccinate synthase [Paraburkholderia strydomiana]|uniref:Argininosuccinate synthase n=1 Tax=Paraburkholderia strydomiana TaxID=1245417 RepID=A0ABW9ERT9_9BURK
MDGKTMQDTRPKKVVLAFSGGLDTSVILKWMQIKYDCEIVTFTADLGQGDEVEAARDKAISLGVKPQNVFVEDLRNELVASYAAPVFRANAAYEGYYLMGTPIARPLVAKRQIEIARAVGADSVAHGATGKGNDQLRFELAYYALAPEVRVIAPWREWDMAGRAQLVAFADAHGLSVGKDKRGAPPYSSDANLLHVSCEGKALEDPWISPEDDAWSRTVAPELAPDRPTWVEIHFERGDPVALDGVSMSPAALLSRLNEIGAANGVGRLDIVDTRYVGLKCRGLFETPGGTIWQVAHRTIESITLDRGEAHLKDELMPKYAELVYNGYWFAPEREMLQALIDKSQERVTGKVRLRLYKGNVIVEGRQSPNTLYDQDLVTFEDGGDYDQRDATGFIRINALRLRLLGRIRNALPLV